MSAKTYSARKTNAATGSDFIYFDVDSTFAAPTERRFKIAVTYRDVSVAQWGVHYSTATLAQKATPTVTNANTGQTKTAIFTLPDASLRGAFGLDASHPMDLRIFSDGTNDVTIRNVHVIRVR